MKKYRFNITRRKYPIFILRNGKKISNNINQMAYFVKTRRIIVD